MARNVTLGDIKERARVRADMVNSGFVSDQELREFINSSIAELWDLLVSSYGEDYLTESFPFTINTSQDEYDLPGDFYKAQGVDLNIGPNNAISIKKFNFSERNRYDGAYYNWGLDGGVRVRYRIVKDKIKFTPIPIGNYTVNLWYIPCAPVLLRNNETLDGVNGFEEYVIIDVARKMLMKEESDTSMMELEKANMKKRIEDMAQDRDAGLGESVQDVQNMNYDFLDGVY